MFPLHNGDELCFDGSSNTTSSQQEYKIPQNPILPDHASMEGKDNIMVTNNVGKGRGRRKPCAIDTGSSNYAKKLMHRDIERQRRQEMATLYASLRALLPLEFIKGKRSISDQMNEAVNYIKHLEKRIKDMGVDRDELKKLSSLSSSTPTGSHSSDHSTSATSIIVRPCLVGVEIVFSCGCWEQNIPLSGVLKMLLDEGLCVVNCVSTRVNETMVHTIHTEINDPSSLNLSELQQKLNQVIASHL